MKSSKFTRLLAVLLIIIMVATSLPMLASAADDTSLVSGFKRTLDEVKDILNTISYEQYLTRYADAADGTSAASVKGTAYDSEGTTAKVSNETYDGRAALHLPDEGRVSWKINVPKTGFYHLEIDYYPVQGKATSVERSLYIDDRIPFSEARSLSMTKVWVDNYVEEFGEFRVDITGNDIRPTKSEAPEWRTYTACDSTGFYVEPFTFYFTAGEHTLSFETVREPVAISEIRLVPPIPVKPYAEVLADWQAKGYKEVALSEPIKINAENPSATSEQVIYPIYDRASAITDPQDASKIKLNTIGSDKWKTVGQWIRYDVEVPESGLYSIASRFRQHKLSGVYTSRRIKVNGEIPFAEASYLQFNYSDQWQSSRLNDGETEFLFYLEAGNNTIEFEVVLGHISTQLNRLNDSLTKLNDAYLQILMITGAVPDQYRDYNFRRIIPESIKSLADQAETIFSISEELKEITGQTGEHVATLNTVATLVDRMASDEDEIAKNLANLKSYLGTLGTWLYTSQGQSLEFDYFLIQKADDPLPKAKANIFEAAWFEIKSFVLSFFNDYTSISSIAEDSEDSTGVTMWFTDGRDQAQILRQMIDYEFTPESNIGVSLKLVAGGSLLPSILAGVGPDVAFLDSASTINYAIRSAVNKLNDFDNFEQVTTERFSPAAMVPLTLYGDAYGLPSTMAFNMMFYRMDVFAELGIELPETWEDMYSILPILQNNKMEVGFPNRLPGTTMMLYQMGGELYADEGKRINLDSNVGLSAFTNLCDLFEKYRFPLTYDAATRFRTGELPLIISGYTTYNTLIVYASELRDAWEMVPLLGYRREDGTINNVSTATVGAIIMPRGAQNQNEAWELMCWFTDAPAQSRYANELVAVLGPAGKYNTANKQALASLPWTANEYKALEAQMNNLAAVPEYPGGYIIARYVDFAFLDVYNNSANPVEAMLDNVTEINKEISRKRKEFGFDYYEISYSTSFMESEN